jgi:hypothetical protein
VDQFRDIGQDSPQLVSVDRAVGPVVEQYVDGGAVQLDALVGQPLVVAPVEQSQDSDQQRVAG